MTGNGAHDRPQNPPWWASVADEVDPDEDPLTAHRAARAGRSASDEPSEDVPYGDEPFTDELFDDEPRSGPSGDPHHDAHAGAPWGDLAEVVLRLARDAARSLGDRERGRATANASAPRGADEAPHEAARHSESCQYCPVCAGLRALEEVRPELVTHLSEAARHVTLAARAFVDAQADRYAGADGFERIDLDDEV